MMNDQIAGYLDRVKLLKLDAFGVSLLTGTLIALVIVLVMQSSMRRRPPIDARIVLYYKLWHYPVFLLSNLLHRQFWTVALATALGLGLIGLGVVGGYFVGAFGGLTGSVVGAVVGLLAAVTACEPILKPLLGKARGEFKLDHWLREGFLRRDLADLTAGEYLQVLRHDMLSGSTDLRTVDRDFLFPVLCLLQTATLLGITGGILGNWVSGQHAHPGWIALASAFFAFLGSHAIGRLKRQGADYVQRLLLGLLQGIVVGFLLLPVKTLLADQRLSASVLESISLCLGGDIGLDAVFISAASVASTAFSALQNPSTP